MNKVWWSLLLLLCSHLALASSSETAIGWKVADHLPYLEARLKQGQLDALEALLVTLPDPDAEQLRWLLLQSLSPLERPEESVRRWVNAQAQRVAQDFDEITRDGFLVSLPRHDYPALARNLLQSWQQLDWQAQYSVQLQQGNFVLRSLYRLNNPDVMRQQSALLAALPGAPLPVLQGLARELARSALFLPDNQLAYALLSHTGEPELFRALWSRPVDSASLQAVSLVTRFHQGGTAGDLLLAAARIPALNSRAMLTLGGLQPLPVKARDYLQRELGIGPQGVSLSRLLKPREESLQLILLADRLLHDQMGPAKRPELGRP